jgi:hypothetical protein
MTPEDAKTIIELLKSIDGYLPWAVISICVVIGIWSPRCKCKCCK